MSDGQSPVPPYEAFDELAQRVVSDHSLDSVMTAIAEVGKKLLPAVAEASVTFLRGDDPQTIASTGRLAVDMDERQYVDGRGPCLQASTEGVVVLVRDAVREERWPHFAAAARQRGVCSSLSLPVKLPAPVKAGLNLYSTGPDAFRPQDEELARTLTAYASVALDNVYLFEAQQRVAEHLERALASRGVIDQAKGIVMAQRRCSADEAFSHLVAVSQRSNRKLRDVAEELVRSTAGG